jgi:hypothetical protein
MKSSQIGPVAFLIPTYNGTIVSCSDSTYKEGSQIEFELCRELLS